MRASCNHKCRPTILTGGVFPPFLAGPMPSKLPGLHISHQWIQCKSQAVPPAVPCPVAPRLCGHHWAQHRAPGCATAGPTVESGAVLPVHPEQCPGPSDNCWRQVCFLWGIFFEHFRYFCKPEEFAEKSVQCQWSPSTDLELIVLMIKNISRVQQAINKQNQTHV